MPTTTARLPGAIEHGGSAPEGRRYYLTVLGRVQFEVSEEEYQRTISATFKVPKLEGPASMTFHTGLIDGKYYDPKKEEVLANGDRT